MPVVDYLEFCARIHNIEKDRIGRRVAEMIRMTGLNKEKHKKIDFHSCGFTSDSPGDYYG